MVLRSFIFFLSSEMENRTLFQMCGRLDLPAFLFRVGLLTLIYIASFMALGIKNLYFLLLRTLELIPTFSINRQNEKYTTNYCQELGKEVLTISRKFERINMKICDYKNHRRFSIRCLIKG